MVLTGWAPPSVHLRRLAGITGIAAVLGFLAYIGVEVNKFAGSLDDSNCERPSATVVVAPATDSHTFCVLDPVTGEERRAVIERGSGSVIIEAGPDGNPIIRTP